MCSKCLSSKRDTRQAFSNVVSVDIFTVREGETFSSHFKGKETEAQRVWVTFPRTG